MWHCSFHSFFSNGRKRYKIFWCSFLCIYLGLHSTESTREWLLVIHVKFWNTTRAGVPNTGSWPSSRPLPIWHWAEERAGKQACIHSSTYASGWQTCSSICASSRHTCPPLVQMELHVCLVIVCANGAACKHVSWTTSAAQFHPAALIHKAKKVEDHCTREWELFLECDLMAEQE